MTWMQSMKKKHNTDEAGVKEIMAARGSLGGKKSPTNFANIPAKKLKEITSRAGRISGQIRRERSAKKLQKRAQKYEDKIMHTYLE